MSNQPDQEPKSEIKSSESPWVNIVFPILVFVVVAVVFLWIVSKMKPAFQLLEKFFTV